MPLATDIVTTYFYIVRYDEGEMEIHEINGHPIYYAPSIELNSYHVWPSTCYWFMLERTTLMGNEIEDGFKAKDMNN